MMVESIVIGRATNEEFDEYRNKAESFIPGTQSYAMVLPREIVIPKVEIAMITTQIDLGRMYDDMIVIFTYGDNNDYVMDWVVL